MKLTNVVQTKARDLVIKALLLINLVFVYVVCFTDNGIEYFEQLCMKICCPVFLFVEEEENIDYIVNTPYLQYLYSNRKDGYVQVSLENTADATKDYIEVVNASDIGIENSADEELARKVQEENNASQIITEGKEEKKAIPEVKQEKKYIIDDTLLHDVSYVRREFFIEDKTTHIFDDMLSYEKLMRYDASVKQDNSLPQILIYHTHSQEGYIDSNPQDAATTIMGVGEYLSEILKKQYGFNVIHHLGMYDVQSRDYAYSNAAKGLEKVLRENPSIEVMIDLHRDEVKEGTRLVTSIDGKDMAKFMLFNGLCYTKELGKLDNLPNAYIQENVATAFQMQLAAKEYYPGLTRKTYLKGYRYNLHYRPKSLLIELGAQTNTLEEAMNTCIPLADIISRVLTSGN